MIKLNSKGLFAAVLTIIFGSSAVAEDDSGIELEAMMVVAVANKKERPILDVVGAVTVITADEISRTNSENMADALRYESNIHMENAGTRFGSSGINIRGIGRNRVAIKVDGISNAKQFSIGSYSNATAIFPETDLIKSVEILNGPASTLYGSDAIGGVVSIHTWDPSDLTGVDNRFTQIRLAFDGKTNGRVATGVAAWDSSDMGAVVAITRRDGKGLLNHDSVQSARDFSAWDEQTLFAKFVADSAASNTLKVGFSGSQRNTDTQINSFIGQGRFSRTTELAAEDESNNYQFSLAYDFDLGGNFFQDGLVRAYVANTKFRQETFEKRRSRRGTPLAQYRRFEYQQRNTGIELNLNSHFLWVSATHDIISGLELTGANIEELRDGAQTNLTTGVISPSILGEEFPRRDFPNSRISQFGVFILDEIGFEGSPWTLIPAIRLDYYDLAPSDDRIFGGQESGIDIVSISESDISPKLGLRYELSEASSAYAQYVRGFRAPPFDDVNIGLNIPLFNIRAIANPGLRSETSDGIEVGYRYFGPANQVELTLFGTSYSNFIETKARIGVDPDTGTLLFQSRNIDEAEIFGAEFSHRWSYGEAFSGSSSLAWTRGNNKTNGQPLNTISPAKAVVNVQWTSADAKWNVSLYSTFTQALSRVDESNDSFFKPPGFAVLDLFVARSLGENQEFRLGIFNLLNKKYWNWQQVRNFDADEPIIDALSQPSTAISFSYTARL